MSHTSANVFDLTAGIAAAYVSHNHIAAVDVPLLLTTLHGALRGLQDGNAIADTAAAAPALEIPSASQIRKSIHPDGLVSFLDGRSHKTLKRHLTAHGLTPDGYRRRFGLPADYPMVCPSYSAQRSSLAKAIGLGVPGAQIGRQAAE
ncbi:MucR family transcriptional regulator [Methylobacterium sp. E-065]|uniref:MucR family transcriptional regulator n=1 Tax=Methylobacterium sp. E-065 TaxID=2836583 RepID=UPI001FBAAEFD|nr:MucR family transcriptional regulator [Methylobacterium sp. E-065]MCJ2020600.1 MucR family transcriptional regulator [Methylobacterium sp. E-065]